jgi:hypothetical protein
MYVCVYVCMYSVSLMFGGHAKRAVSVGVLDMGIRTYVYVHVCVNMHVCMCVLVSL